MKPYVPVFLATLALLHCGRDDGNNSRKGMDGDIVAGRRDAGTGVRKMVTRARFGNMGVRGNTLQNADFEFVESAPSWIATGPRKDRIVPLAVSGGQCRSGLACAAYPVGTQVTNMTGVANTGDALSLSLAISPKSGRCVDVRVFISGISANAESVLRTEAKSAEHPDIDGFCTFQASALIDVPLRTVGIAVDLRSTDAIIDDGRLVRKIPNGERRLGVDSDPPR